MGGSIGANPAIIGDRIPAGPPPSMSGSTFFLPIPSLMAAHITITAYVAIAVCVAEQTGKQPS